MPENGYGTIGSLLTQNHVSLNDLCRWADRIRKMPYYKKLDLGGRTCIIVHAGYPETAKDTGGILVIAFMISGAVKKIAGRRREQEK